MLVTPNGVNARRETSWAWSFSRVCPKREEYDWGPTFVSWSWSWWSSTTNIVWLCLTLLGSFKFLISTIRKSHWERMTLVSNFSSRIIIDSSFSITPNLSESCGNLTKEILEGLHADRVYRSYFELEVSLLNGKKQTYSDITCRATLGRIIIQYLWTEMHQTPSNWWIGPVCWIIAFTGHGMVGESPKAKLA